MVNRGIGARLGQSVFSPGEIWLKWELISEVMEVNGLLLRRLEVRRERTEVVVGGQGVENPMMRIAGKSLNEASYLAGVVMEVFEVYANPEVIGGREVSLQNSMVIENKNWLLFVENAKGGKEGGVEANAFGIRMMLSAVSVFFLFIV